MNDLLKYRSQFDSLNDCTYLISNSLGAMPNSARDWSNKFVDLWQSKGVRAWEEEWWMLSRTVGDKIAYLMNAAPDSISMHQNVTTAQTVILSCFDFSQKRNKVVMVGQEFPSLLYLYQRWLENNGKLEIVRCPDGITAPTKDIVDAIDDSTALVSISHVLFKSSFIVNIKPIVEKAHQVGAKVMLDVYQSIGVLPIDLQEMDVDFASGGCLKWLCGGPTACFLYVNPSLNEQLKPRFTGWSAHENPFAFDKKMSYTTGSYRFLNGTPVIQPLLSCQAGIDLITEIGVDNIRERSMEMTERIVEHAKNNNWNVYTPMNPYERAGTVSLSIPDALEISQKLLQHNFIIDYRPVAGVRVSPHFYNTDDEIDSLIEEIKKLVKQ